jgi:hypothetical protein
MSPQLRSKRRAPLAAGALIVLLSLALDAQDRGSDWPQFRGPGRQGLSPDKGLPVTWSNTENIVWKVEPPGSGTSSPAILDSRIFLTAYSGFGVPRRSGGAIDQLKLHVLCLNRADGKTLWEKEVAPSLPEQEKIREDHGYASSTPAADAERLYVFFGKSGVFAFDHGGRQIWRREVGSTLHGWGSAASPVIAGDLVIVNASVESESLVALDKKTGEVRWEEDGIKDSWNTPILVPAAGGKNELVLAIMGKVLGLEPASGELLWSCATDIGWYMVPSLVADQGVVYCVGGRSGGGLAVRTGGRGDVTGSHRLWTMRKGSNVTSPVFHDGHVYWMHENLGIAYCAEAKTGNIVYEERIERASQVYASAVLADGKIYYVSRPGRAFVVAAKPSFELLAANELGNRETFNASPAVAGGRLYLRSDRFLYCLGKK